MLSHPVIAPKEAAFRKLLVQADCEDRFECLWACGVKSARGIRMMAMGELLQCGLAEWEARMLKSKAED